MIKATYLQEQIESFSCQDSSKGTLLQSLGCGWETSIKNEVRGWQQEVPLECYDKTLELSRHAT